MVCGVSKHVKAETVFTARSSVSTKRNILSALRKEPLEKATFLYSVSSKQQSEDTINIFHLSAAKTIIFNLSQCHCHKCQQFNITYSMFQIRTNNRAQEAKTYK